MGQSESVPLDTSTPEYLFPARRRIIQKYQAGLSRKDKRILDKLLVDLQRLYDTKASSYSQAPHEWRGTWDEHPNLDISLEVATSFCRLCHDIQQSLDAFPNAKAFRRAEGALLKDQATVVLLTNVFSEQYKTFYNLRKQIDGLDLQEIEPASNLNWNSQLRDFRNKCAHGYRSPFVSFLDPNENSSDKLDLTALYNWWKDGREDDKNLKHVTKAFHLTLKDVARRILESTVYEIQNWEKEGRIKVEEEEQSEDEPPGTPILAEGDWDKEDPAVVTNETEGTVDAAVHSFETQVLVGAAVGSIETKAPVDVDDWTDPKFASTSDGTKWEGQLSISQAVVVAPIPPPPETASIPPSPEPQAPIEASKTIRILQSTVETFERIVNRMPRIGESQRFGVRHRTSRSTLAGQPTEGPAERSERRERDFERLMAKERARLREKMEQLQCGQRISSSSEGTDKSEPHQRDNSPR